MNPIEESAVVFEPTARLLHDLTAYVPRLIAMSVILIAGLILAAFLTWLVRRTLELSGFDSFSRRIGLSELLERSGIPSPPTRLAALIVRWTALFLVFLAALSALNLEIVNELVRRALDFVPNLLVAAVILVIGHLLSDFVADGVAIGCVNADFPLAGLAALAARLLVLFFFISVALSQLRIGQQIITAAFSILFGGLVLAIALSFGLGGKDLAKEWMEQAVKKKTQPPAEGKGETLSHL